MDVELKKLSENDGIDVYELLQVIPKDENGFQNNVNGKDFDKFKNWLKKQVNLSNGIGLEDWMVKSTSYFLYVDDKPVGFGKLRHSLTDALKITGGHIGYSVAPLYRGKGYGKKLLKLLLKEAKKLDIEQVLITVQNDNIASIKVALANGGTIEKVSDERHYIIINTTSSDKY